jgi:hypothetical protein
LPGGFVPVHEELAIASRGIALFLRTASALRLRRAIAVALTAPMPTAIAQGLAFWAVVDVLLELIAELLSREVPSRLLPAVDDGNVGWMPRPSKPVAWFRSSAPFVTLPLPLA